MGKNTFVFSFNCDLEQKVGMVTHFSVGSPGLGMQQLPWVISVHEILMQAGSGSPLKSCLRAWKEGGPSWCPPGEPWGLCQSLAWASLHPQLSLEAWPALRGSPFAGGRGWGGRGVACVPATYTAG